MEKTITDFDRELSEGAGNAINVCLKLKPEERVTIISDNENLEIASSLAAEIRKIGSDYSLMVIEDYAPRPIKSMPAPILEDLAMSQVSIFCASAHEGELGSRIQMTEVIDRHKIRHAHMVNIEKQIMKEGMRADFIKIDEISRRLIEKARKTKIIAVKSNAGTDLTAEFSPKLKWIKTSGLISAEKWGNLPGGEIFTSPLNVNGVFAVDGVVGDYLCKKYGDLKDNPIIIEIKDSRITNMSCENKTLLEEFTRYTMTDENSNRVGEFAIGTNICLKHVIGNILQDEKLPTVHMAFGHPYTKYTGADWESTTHIDCVSVKCSAWFDGALVMEKGKFLI
ncbi:MAG: aminopeptidase [Chlorobi bacterium]|nr:aminopeptidase [Chlorobiota bacterium]MCI0715939.1 aminopeptidase [Chlorobiota bacterium]